MITNNLINLLSDEANLHKLADIRIGLSYTAIQLDNGNIGLSYTARTPIGESCTRLKESGQFIGKDAYSILQWLNSDIPLARTIALATANALIPLDSIKIFKGSVIKKLGLTEDDKIGMIGFFAPMIPILREYTSQIYIFDKGKNVSQLSPLEDMPIILPQCSIIFISSTTIINGTYNDVLRLCSNAREIIMIGPSTPMLPKVFEETNITWLSGRKIIDSEKLLEVVSQAGGTHKFSKITEKINIRIK